MSGSMMLSDEEKREMLEDAKNVRRGKAFMSAREKSQEGSLDEYIDFLSESMDIIKPAPSGKVATKFKL